MYCCGYRIFLSTFLSTNPRNLKSQCHNFPWFHRAFTIISPFSQHFMGKIDENCPRPQPRLRHSSGELRLVLVHQCLHRGRPEDGRAHHDPVPRRENLEWKPIQSAGTFMIWWFWFWFWKGYWVLIYVHCCNLQMIGKFMIGKRCWISWIMKKRRRISFPTRNIEIDFSGKEGDAHEWACVCNREG